MNRKLVQGSSSQYVRLNVGGVIYFTTVGTLTKQDSALRDMFTGKTEIVTDSEGWAVLDYNGHHFDTLLAYLRDDYISLPSEDWQLKELLAEARGLRMKAVVEACERRLRERRQAARDASFAYVHLVASPKEEDNVLANTDKPVVKLLMNKRNNKYSYASHADENLLKNAELFDKLSMSHSGRILFMKNVAGLNEICCWSFYGNGKRVAEICCTSIVYATDKKHTKIEYPEARIYEELLNVLLYEPRREEPEVLIATSEGDVFSAFVPSKTSSASVAAFSFSSSASSSSSSSSSIASSSRQLLLSVSPPSTTLHHHHHHYHHHHHHHRSPSSSRTRKSSARYDPSTYDESDGAETKYSQSVIK